MDDNKNGLKDEAPILIPEVDVIPVVAEKKARGRPFVKGERRVGRAKGTPNKTTIAFSENLKKAGFDFFVKLNELYVQTNDDAIRARILELVAKHSFALPRAPLPESTLPIQLITNPQQNNNLLMVVQGKGDGDKEE